MDIFRYKILVILITLLCGGVNGWTTQTASEPTVRQAFMLASEPIKELLPNGLTVILKEVHTAPVVTLELWVKTGSINEGRFMGSGISHFVEHMLFKGTKKRKVGEIAQTIQELGGDIGGYTSFENTVYHISVASRYFKEALDVLSDVLMNSSFEPEEVEKEKQVILKEINMNNDDPDRFLTRQFFETAYFNHPYRHPIIGYKKLFEAVSRDDLLSYYHERYVPNNMILVVCGDFNESVIMPEIKEAFREFERGSIEPKYIPEEPEQLSPRRFEKAWDTRITRLEMGFHTTSIGNTDIYPLDLLAIILGEGQSSKFTETIKEEKQLVHSISAWSYTPLYPGIFNISLTLDYANLDKSLEAIWEVLNELKIIPLDDTALKKAKRKALSTHIFGKETIESLARTIASDYFFTGDINFSKKYLDGIINVTEEDILRVSRKYFTEENLTTAILKPMEEEETGTETIEVESRNEIKKVVLENGLTVLVRENHNLPIVSMKAVFLGGVRFEEERNNGICNFVQQMLLKGTKHRTRQEIVNEIESKGGSISSYGGNNSFGCSLNCLSEDFDSGLNVLTDVIINPTFPIDEMEKERKIILARIKSQQDEIFEVATQLLRETLFEKHPYKFQSVGREESISNLTQEEMIKFHQENCVPNNMVLAIFGDVEADKVIEKVKNSFAQFKGRPLPIVEIPQEPELEDIRKVSKIKEKEQTVILVGYPGITVKSKDRYIFEVMTALLSNQDSRLYMSIREKLGIAYYVGAFEVLGVDPGFYVLYCGTTPEKKALAIEGLMGEILKLKTEFVGDKELERAKKNLIGTREIGLQTNETQAFESALDELYGLRFDHGDKYPEEINKVTKEEIMAVANKYFKDVYVEVTVGP